MDCQLMVEHAVANLGQPRREKHPKIEKGIAIREDLLYAAERQLETINDLTARKRQAEYIRALNAEINELTAKQKALCS